MNWLYNFMAGRNGVDQLSIGLLVSALVINILARFFYFAFPLPLVFQLLSAAIMVWCIFRILSRNITRRRQENDKFLSIWNAVRGWFSKRRDTHLDKKTHKYFTCPKCGQKLRVPKGKGKIRITCAKCGNRFERRT